MTSDLFISYFLRHSRLQTEAAQWTWCNQNTKLPKKNQSKQKMTTVVSLVGPTNGPFNQTLTNLLNCMSASKCLASWFLFDKLRDANLFHYHFVTRPHFKFTTHSNLFIMDVLLWFYFCSMNKWLHIFLLSIIILLFISKL